MRAANESADSLVAKSADVHPVREELARGRLAAGTRDCAAETRTGAARLSLVVAMDQARLIGRQGRLPWHLPKDLAHFKRLTLGKTILMGRRTWDSLGRALPGRENWVLSRDPVFAPVGARTFPSIGSALSAQADGELMVIGGAELYRQTLGAARRLYVTQVLVRLEGRDASDVHFPDFDETRFQELEREDHPADERHAWPYRFLTLERN
ncbi:MAG: dihydrofolate reductase [Panacagrimonas sp.]